MVPSDIQSAVEQVLQTKSLDEILFTNTPEKPSNGLKPISKSYPLFEQGTPDDIIKPPISNAAIADDFWERIEREQRAWIKGKTVRDPSKRLYLNARLLTAWREKKKDAPKLGWKEIDKPSKLFELMKREEKDPSIKRFREQCFNSCDSFSYSGSGLGGYLGPVGGPSNFNSEYAPLLGGPWSKQLYIRDQLDGNAKAFEAWNHNPVVHSALMIKHNFVYGRGVKVTCQTEKQQDFWENWARVTDFKSRFNKVVIDAAIAGEVALRYFERPKPETLTWRSIDTSSIWEIIHAPEDIEQVYSYWQNYPTPFFLTTLPGVPVTEYIVRHIPPQEVDFLRLNVTSYERRGRPDCYAALTYSKWLKDDLWANIIRDKIQNTYLWDVLVKGNAGDVNNTLNVFPNPQNPAMIFAHNEAVEVKSTNPQLAPRGRFFVAEILITLIAVSMGIPAEFIGATSGKSSRAGAVVSSEPSTKHFQDRQEQLGWLIKRMAFRLFSRAEALGLLPKTTDEEKEVRIQWPSIAKEDRTPLLQDLKMAEQMLWLSKRTTAGIAAEEFDQENYDFDDEQEEIKADKENGAFGEAFTDAYPQGVTAPAEEPEPPGTVGTGPPQGGSEGPIADLGPPPNVPKEKPTNGNGKYQKDAKNNPISSQIGGLKKALKTSERPVISISLSESDLD